MTFGAYYHGGAGAPEIGVFAHDVEQLGYSAMWIGDGPVGRDRIYLDPFTALAYAAAHTDQIALGCAVVLLPLYEPVRLAHAVSTLDVLSGGRAVLGAGVGGEYEKQFEAFGIEMRTRGHRADEYLDILVKLWTEGAVTVNGDFRRFDEISMSLRPVQEPHPPIWIGGRLGGRYRRADGAVVTKSRVAAVRRAARYGQGWLPYNITVRQFDESVRLLGDQARSNGRDPAEISLGLDNAWLMTDKSLGSWRPGQPANEHLAAVVAEYQAEGTRSEVVLAIAERLARSGLIGGPRELIGRTRAFAAVGARHFICNVQCGPHLMLDQLRSIAREVVPHFQASGRTP